uniref:Uncharacterized protein n=1 Tax=Anguilla anguilla TaxID=7936 RepID=A0A0E9T9L9_ANGAN
MNAHAFTFTKKKTFSFLFVFQKISRIICKWFLTKYIYFLYEALVI